MSRPHEGFSETNCPHIPLLRWGLLTSFGLLWLACGGQPDGPGSEPVAPDAPVNAPVTHDAPAPRPSAPEPAELPTPETGSTASDSAPSRAECLGLLDHFLSVAHAEHAATVSPELVPTREQLAEIRSKLEPEFLPVCRAYARSTYDCIASARTREQIMTCDAL